MAIRRGPKTGYNFGNKKQYRRTIWRTFRDHCVGMLKESRGLLMPSIEGDEIDVAIQNGFREDNLSICDRNPAIVATLKRRYPHIKTFGVDLKLAIERHAKMGRSWDVANLDFTSCISRSMTDTLWTFATAGVMRRGLIAVTTLRGREQPGMFSYITQIAGKTGIWCGQDVLEYDKSCQTLEDGGTTDRGRIAILRYCLSGNWHEKPWKSTNIATLVRCGSYKSEAGSQTMLWSVFRLHKMPCLCMQCQFATHCYLENCAIAPTQNGDWTSQAILELLTKEWGMTNEEMIALWDRDASIHVLGLTLPGGRKLRSGASIWGADGIIKAEAL